MKQGAVAARKRSARSHTSAARGFLVGVFTTDALKECSLKGNLSKGPLGKTNEARPGLFGPGLAAVLGAARQLAKDRKLEIMKDSVVNHEL
ncbi:Putative BEN domain-containing protein B1 [Frankliniella fusca]|uniref:BEN domain-containing protein B1 n=1 Tax=Frankliniella fusca TaxID=407009 RepID=A0AAE1HPV4_9NEOP|nr:Putative BEN domain-containing protein B1 [Frankliniella fusca]